MWPLTWKSTAVAALTAPLWGSALLVALAAGWLLATPAAVLGLVFVVVPKTISQTIVFARDIATLGLHASLRRARDRFAPVVVNYVAYRWIPWPARWLGRFLMRFQGVRNVVESVETVAYAAGTSMWQTLSHVAQRTLEAGDTTNGGQPRNMGALYGRIPPPSSNWLVPQGSTDLGDTAASVHQPFPPPAQIAQTLTLPGQFEPTMATSPIPSAPVNVDHLYRGYGTPLTPEEARHRQALHAKTLAKALAGRPGFPSVSKSPKRPVVASLSPQKGSDLPSLTAKKSAQASQVGVTDEQVSGLDYDEGDPTKASSMAV